MPSLSTVQTALGSLSAVLIEKYPDFRMSSHEASKIESLLNKLVKDKVLYKGKWRKPQRVGFKTVLASRPCWLWQTLG